MQGGLQKYPWCSYPSLADTDVNTINSQMPSYATNDQCRQSNEIDKPDGEVWIRKEIIPESHT